MDNYFDEQNGRVKFTISRPGLPGWLWNLWPVNWRAVTRQFGPGPPPGRLAECPTLAKDAPVTGGGEPTHTLHGTRARLEPTPVHSGQVQST